MLNTCEKLKTLYLHYHSAYGHKTYLDGDITQGASTNKFTRPLNEVVIGVKRQIKYFMSPLAEHPWAPNKARCYSESERRLSSSYMIPGSRDQREVT